MYKRTIFFTYILSINFSLIYANYNVICPSNQLWNLRARSKCQFAENYTCLIDSVKHIYKESCMGPRTEPPGDKTVVNSGNFDTKQCPSDRFQPFSFSSTQGNNCIFMKTICSDEGQIVYNNGTTKTDRECRCDYTKSFSFLSSSRKTRCSCDPTTEDCSCFIKPCGHGKILSQDYECIKNEDFYGTFVCEEIDTRKNRPSDGLLRYLKGSGNRERVTIKTEAQLAALTLIILTGGIFITVLVVLLRMQWITDKIVKIFNIDNGMNDNFVAEIHSPLTSEEKPNSSKNVNKDSTSKSSGFSTGKKTKAKSLEVNTSIVNDSFEGTDTCMKKKMNENYMNGNEMGTANSKSQDMESSQSAMLPKHSENPVYSPDTHKRLPLKMEEYLYNENSFEKSHINAATDYINNTLTTDQKLREANNDSLTVQQPDGDSCHAIQRNDENLEPEGEKCKNEISEKVLESYKNDAYISTVLKDLIDRGILSSYNSKEKLTTYPISEKTEKAEHEIVRIAIQKNRNNYIIQRTNLETPQTKLLQEMKNVFTDTVKMALEKTEMTVNGLLSIIGRNNTHDG